MATEFDPDEVIRQVTERMREKHPTADAAAVEKIVSEEVGALADKPVHDYVSVLAERAAKKRIKALDS